MKNKIFYTPVGWAGVVVSEKGISRIVLPKKSRKAAERELRSAQCRVRSAEKTAGRKPDPASARNILSKATHLLQHYFSGEHVVFDLPLDFGYYTLFQQAAWRAAAEIPFGETRSYGWIAQRIGKPLASRAVGQAMGANPLPVIIPCHRVIGSAGSLCGFSGGLGMKKKLLGLESREKGSR